MTKQTKDTQAAAEPHMVYIKVDIPVGKATVHEPRNDRLLCRQTQPRNPAYVLIQYDADMMAFCQICDGMLVKEQRAREAAIVNEVDQLPKETQGKQADDRDAILKPQDRPDLNVGVLGLRVQYVTGGQGFYLENTSGRILIQENQIAPLRLFAHQIHDFAHFLMNLRESVSPSTEVEGVDVGDLFRQMVDSA